MITSHYSSLLIRSITGFFYCLAFWGIFLLLPPAVFSLLLATIFMIIVINEMPQLIPVRSLRSCLFIAAYLVIPFSLMIYLNHTDHTVAGILFFLAMAHDTGAYLIGSFFGRNLLCPSISPKKTWEGFIGGFIITMAGCIWLQTILRISYSLQAMVIIALLITLTATAGDLFESWLKRNAGIKDTGNILPGHGGLLDRFDSIIFLIAIFYLIRPFLPSI